MITFCSGTVTRVKTVTTKSATGIDSGCDNPPRRRQASPTRKASGNANRAY
jgi:hypothetical protein